VAKISIGDFVDGLGNSLDCIFKSTGWTVQLDLGNDGNIMVFRDDELIYALAEAYKYKYNL